MVIPYIQLISHEIQQYPMMTHLLFEVKKMFHGVRLRWLWWHMIRRLENYHCNSKAAESNMFMQRCFSNLLLSVHKRKRMSIHGIQLVLVYASYPGLSLYCIVLKPNKCGKKKYIWIFLAMWIYSEQINTNYFHIIIPEFI